MIDREFEVDSQDMGSAMRAESAGSDTVVTQLQDFVNAMDVDSTPYDLPDQIKHIVLDTNILLGFLDVVQRFADTLEKYSIPALFIIPGIVIDELDNQKERRDDSLSWSSRRASAWLWQMMKPTNGKADKRRKVVRGQAYTETLQRSGRWKIRDSGTNNDDLIVDCCLYLHGKLHKRVVSVSADYNLSTKVSEQGIFSVNPRDKKDWSARDLANVVFGAEYPQVSKFPAYVRVHRPPRVSDALDDVFGPIPEAVKQPPEDGMEIDDDYTNNFDQRDPLPSHILDRLHLEIIDYFSPLLLDITKRAAPEAFVGTQQSRTGAVASIHSPYNGAPNKKWTPCECIEVLTDTRSKSGALSRLKISHSDAEYLNQIKKGARELGDFLTRPYEGRGRRGQDWTQASWESCLRTLYAVGLLWKSELICSSLHAAWQELANTFNMAMKPTGM